VLTEARSRKAAEAAPAFLSASTNTSRSNEGGADVPRAGERFGSRAALSRKASGAGRGGHSPQCKHTPGRATWRCGAATAAAAGAAGWRPDGARVAPAWMPGAWVPPLENPCVSMNQVMRCVGSREGRATASEIAFRAGATKARHCA
jgi:hypothetical protein